MNILQLDYQATTGMVHTIHWDATENTARVYGSVEIPPADPEDMIPYAELDTETVTGWLEDALGASGLARVADKLAEQLEPADSVAGLPWA
jgi:hypothetical protein